MRARCDGTVRPGAMLSVARRHRPAMGRAGQGRARPRGHVHPPRAVPVRQGEAAARRQRSAFEVRRGPGRGPPPALAAARGRPLGSVRPQRRPSCA